MKSKILLLAVISVIFNFTNCGESKKSKVGNDFYEIIKAKDYNKLSSLLSKKALEESPKEVWINVFKNIDEKYGALKSYFRTSFYVGFYNGIEGTDQVYKVIYEKGTLYQKLKFLKEGDEYKLSFFRSVKNKSDLKKKSAF